jgi:hypothetical protein
MKTIDYLKVIVLSSLSLMSISIQADSQIDSDKHPMEVACRYQTKVTYHGKSQSPKDNSWFFWRTANMIQTRDADGDHGEIWEALSKGGVQYRKLYHSDKTAVEYMPADQQTNNISTDWFKLSSMLSQQELDDLKLIKKTELKGRSAELRQGKKDDQEIEVLWLVNEQLPATIIRKDKSGSVELRLVEIFAFANAPWKPNNIEEIANYRHIDSTDFGDMENDPFVKKIMTEQGHHHH